MKNLLITLLVLISEKQVYAQAKQALINYKDGKDILTGLFLNRMHLNLDIEDSLVHYNRYFELIFTISKEGSLKGDAFVFSIGDSTKAPYIIQALKRTQGKWINKTGRDVQVVLPIYTIYKESQEKESTEKIPFFFTACLL
jgi:hypothetical protein